MPFRSSWMAGFESACHVNSKGGRVDMVAATQHDLQADADYAALRGLGIAAARDGVRWHLIDRGGRYDFSSLAAQATAARRHGVQVVWTLCHYGWPDDIDLFSPAFVDRFARYCAATARFLREQDDAVPFYTPINEISFFSWAVGEAAYMFPYAHGRAGELKRQLVLAAVAGGAALRAVDPRVRLVHVDPLIHVVPPRGRPDLAAAARAQREAQFEAWDLLAGQGALDVVGINFYHANEWEHPDIRMRWEDDPRDDRWVPFHKLLAEAARRYGRPLLVAETSHFGVGRAPWLREIAAEVRAALDGGVPVEAVCLYPILDRPDWEDPGHWHNSGLWDLVSEPDGRLKRVLNEPYAEEFRRARELLPG